MTYRQPYPRERAKLPDYRMRLPPGVREAFRRAPGRLLNLEQLSVALGYSPRTLRRHCDLGNINWHRRGVGANSVHRVFTLKDVQDFWNTMERMELDQLNKRRKRKHAKKANGARARHR